MKKIKVLVIDDSLVAQKILAQGLSTDPNIQVIDTASDPYIARDKIIEKQPDVLTLDVEMPKMNGVEFLKRLMPQYPLPVIMVSSLTKKGATITLAALHAGAIDFVAKPKGNQSGELSMMIRNLCEKVKMASKVNLQQRNFPSPTSPIALSQVQNLSQFSHKVIAIGSSTGGTEALHQILAQLPQSTPGILIAQHMPKEFTQMFANRLNQVTQMNVKEAETGDLVRPGQVLIAPGKRQMEIRPANKTFIVSCHSTEKVGGHAPSVDVLFRSVAKHVGANAIGVMLTGMGEDGADAMLAMRQRGAHTLAQDKKSSVVFGMPNEAYKRGGAENLISLKKIPAQILELVQST